MQFIDLYKILGVGRRASAAEIKTAYRGLARQLHPDISKLPDAKTRFQILSDAYQILNDPLRRRLYNYQYDKYQEWLRHREATIAAQEAYSAAHAQNHARTYKTASSTTQKQGQAQNTPPPIFRKDAPHARNPDSKTRARQRTTHAEPYVSMHQMRQKQFLRYIPTIRTIAIIIWIFAGVQILDRMHTRVLAIEKVQAASLSSSQWAGVWQRVETGKRFFREDIYGYVDLIPGDLLQFEETWLFKRETNFLLIYTSKERVEKKMGYEYMNRIFLPWYIITFLLILSSLAGYFLPDKMAELRFKFGLSCIFFFFLSIAVNLVF